MQDIWKILGIEPTTEKKKIKKAYAEMVKIYHPEEHPKEYKELRDAYQLAINYASYTITNQQVSIDNVDKLANDYSIDILQQKQDSEEAKKYLFQDEFQEEVEKERLKFNEKINTVFLELDALNKNEKKRKDFMQWLAILQSPEAIETRDSIEFAYRLYSFLNEQDELNVDVRQAIEMELEIQYKIQNSDDVYNDIHFMLDVSEIKKKLEAKAVKKKRIIMSIFFVISILNLFFNFTSRSYEPYSERKTNNTYDYKDEKVKKEESYRIWLDQLSVESRDDGKKSLYINDRRKTQLLIADDFILPYSKLQIVYRNSTYRFYSYADSKEFETFYTEVYPLDATNDNQFQNPDKSNAKRHLIEYFIVKEVNRESYYVIDDKGNRVDESVRNSLNDYENKKIIRTNGKKKLVNANS